MELDLRYEIVKYNRTVYCQNVMQEENAEVIVPDSQPDILRILRICGSVMLRSKEADNGRVAVVTAVSIAVLYTSDGQDVHKIDLSVPVTLTGAGADITPDCDITADARLVSADASMMNPRKITVSVGVAADITCSGEAELRVPTGVCGGADSAQTLAEPLELRLPVSCVERRFSLTDELELPDDADVYDGILTSAAELKDSEWRLAGDRLVVKGTAEVQIVCRGAGKTPVLTLCRELEYTQALDTLTLPGEPEADITAALTSVYADVSDQSGSARTLSVELHAVVQCRVYARKTVSCLIDAYTCGGAFDASFEELCAETFPLAHSGSCSASATFDTGDRPVQIIDASALCGAVSVLRDSDQKKLRIPVGFTLLCSEGGELTAMNARAYAEYELPDNLSDICAVRLHAGKAACSADGGSVKAVVPIEVDVLSAQKMRCDAVSGFVPREQPDPEADFYSVVVYRPAEGESLWDIGKRYRAEVGEIAEQNGLNEGEQPAQGALLLIPCAHGRGA